MFNAKILFVEDYYNEGGENCFYKIPAEKHGHCEKPDWVMKVNTEIVSYVNTYSMIFNEKEKDKIYYWMLDPASDGENRKEGDDYFFNLCFFKYGDTSEQKPNVVKRFNTKHIYCNSEVFNNKSFTKLLMLDGVDYRSPMFFDIEKGTTECIKIGTDITAEKNLWARENLLVNYQDHNSQRWIYDCGSAKKTKSNFDGWYHRLSDCVYSEDQKKYIEVVDDNLLGLKVGHTIDNQQQTFSSQEISRMMFIHPYMIFCKGSRQIIIRSFDRVRESIIYEIAPNELFMSFINLSDSNSTYTYCEQDEMYPGVDEQKRNQFEVARGSHSIRFGFMTNDGRRVYLKVLKFYPYARQSGFIVEKYVYKTSLKKSDLPQKEIIKAYLCQFNFAKYNTKIEMSNLVIQFSDQILVKSLLQDYSFAVAKNLAPLQMFHSNIANYPEFFYITNERDGSKIRMLTYQEGTTDITRTCYKQPGIKIIMFVQRAEKLFILDENLTCKVFEIHTDHPDKASKVKFLFNLEMSQTTKDDLQNYKESLLIPFLKAHMSKNYGLHIGNHFYQLHDTPAKALSYNSAEDMTYMDREIDIKARTFLRGPFSFQDTRDNLAYYYQDYEGMGYMFFMNCLGSKLNFLANTNVNYASFIETDIPKEERILVQIGTAFFIFKPNGQIMSEVKIKDKKLRSEYSLSVQGVSDNAKYFVFYYINKVFELVHHPETDTYSFQTIKKYALIPQENDAKILSQRGHRKAAATSSDFKKAATEGCVNGKTQNKVTKGILPINELPEEEHQDVSSSRLKEERKEEEGPDDGYVSEEDIIENHDDYQNVEGSFQIGDDGSIWNLFYNNKEKRAYLRVDRHNFEAKYVPEAINEHLREESYNRVDMVLVDKYLIFALQKDRPYIFYIEIDLLNDTIVSKRTREIRLELSKEWTFDSIKHVNSTSRIQIQLHCPDTEITSIVTWDLNRNIEDRNIEIKDTDIRVSKGVNSTLNYINVQNTTYDIEYGFPLKFFADTDGLYIYSEFFENPMSEGKDLLALRESSCLMCSVTLSENQRRFLSQFEYMKNEILQKKSFPIIFTEFRTQDGSNLFHFLIQDIKALKNFHEDYMKIVNDIDDEEEVKKKLELYLLILYPNQKEITPFEIALKKSSQYVDFFLRMLAEVPDYPLSRYIFNELSVFRKIMRMNIPSFENFLNRCQFQTATMQNVQVRYWKHGDAEQHITGHNSSLITQPFARKFLGRGDEDPEEEDRILQEEAGPEVGESRPLSSSQGDELVSMKFSKIRKKRFDGISVSLKKNSAEEKKRESEMGGEKRRIQISMVEFDWIFQGPEGKFFIEELSEAPSDDIFKVETIRLCLDFLWDYYFYRILLYVQLPYMLFFISFLVYSSRAFEEENEKESTLNVILGILDITYCFYSLVLELKQAILQGKNYYNSTSVIWNLIDIFSTIFVLATIIGDFAGTVSVEDMMAISSMAVFLLWLKLFYFMRIFSATAAFIRMITEIISDMAIFSFIYAMANLAFANAFFLLEGGFTGVVAEGDRVTDTHWWRILIYTYMTGLGEFETGYRGSENEAMFWIYFFFCTILIPVVLLNLLIAIMGDTFSRVQEIRQEAEMKERCKLISENWFWVNQAKTFKRIKYIAVANLEKADETLPSAWEGQISALKAYFGMQIGAVAKSLKHFKTEQKAEMNNMQKNLNLKISNQATTSNTQYQAMEQFQLDVTRKLDKLLARK